MREPGPATGLSACSQQFRSARRDSPTGSARGGSTAIGQSGACAAACPRPGRVGAPDCKAGAAGNPTALRSSRPCRRAGSGGGCPGARLAGPQAARPVSTRASGSAPGTCPRGLRTPTAWKPAPRCSRQRPKVGAAHAVVRGREKGRSKPRTDRGVEEARRHSPFVRQAGRGDGAQSRRARQRAGQGRQGRPLRAGVSRLRRRSALKRAWRRFPCPWLQRSPPGPTLGTGESRSE